MNSTDSLTLGIALLGAALGVINTVHAVWQDRVRLKVSASRWLDNTGGGGLCVTVVNLSQFAVTIDAIRVPISRKEEYFSLDLLRDLPKRLEPRASHTFRFSSGAFEHPKCPKRGRFRVRTACGIVRHTRKATLE